MEIKPFDKKFFSLISQPRVVSLLGVAGNFCPITRHMPFSSNPFLYGFSIAKSTHTVGLIQKEEKFTLEFFDQNHRESIHALGKTSGKDIDKGIFDFFSNASNSQLSSFSSNFSTINNPRYSCGNNNSIKKDSKMTTSFYYLFFY